MIEDIAHILVENKYDLQSHNPTRDWRAGSSKPLYKKQGEYLPGTAHRVLWRIIFCSEYKTNTTGAHITFIGPHNMCYRKVTRIEDQDFSGQLAEIEKYVLLTAEKISDG